MVDPNIDFDDVYNPLDYKTKYEKTVEILNEALFSEVDSLIAEVGEVKSAKKNAIKPTLTPQMVSIKLDSVLRQTIPIPFEEAKEIDVQLYIDAYHYFCELMLYINKYITFSSTKQMFSAFIGITVDTFNSLMSEPKYADTLAGFNDGLVNLGFISGESGLVSTESINMRLTAKGAGHSLEKASDTISFVQNNYGNDERAVRKKLEYFENFVQIEPPKEKSKKKSKKLS